jgi:AcrR family transcriptional regulator
MTQSVPYDHVEGCHGGRMKGDERREQLIRVAMNLFAKKGFKGTTTKEIAQAAGVNEALIFRHFPTKDALYEAILRWKIDQSGGDRWMAILEPLARERDDAGLFGTVMREMLKFHRENPEFMRLNFYAVLEEHSLANDFREQQIKPLYEYLRDYVTMRQSEGAFDPSFDPGSIVRALFGMPFYHSMISNFFHCNMLQVTDDDAVHTFVRLAIGGLRRSQTRSATEGQE